MDQEKTVEIDIDRAARLLENIEQDLRALRQIIGYANPRPMPLSILSGFSDEQGVEGVFDGEKMVDESGKTYQVSANYASKSKLVEGDPLKLYITSDGKFFYKQLGPIARRTVPATLRAEGNHFVVDTDEGETYSILTASVTYYMSLFGVKPGDRVSILLPAEGVAHWAVIDNIL